MDLEISQAAVEEAELAVDSRKARVAHVGVENYNVSDFNQWPDFPN